VEGQTKRVAREILYLALEPLHDFLQIDITTLDWVMGIHHIFHGFVTKRDACPKTSRIFATT
jgi:hypothetical protein